MKALDWAETVGNFVTIDICPSIYLASEVLNPQSVTDSILNTKRKKGERGHPAPMVPTKQGQGYFARSLCWTTQPSGILLFLCFVLLQRDLVKLARFLSCCTPMPHMTTSLSECPIVFMHACLCPRLPNV